MSQSPLTNQLLPLFWPTEQHLDVAIGVGHPARTLAYPIQLSTAIANFAICIGLLYMKLPAEVANRIARDLDEAFVGNFKTDPHNGRVSDVLRLESERNLWVKWSNSSAMDTCSNYDTIYRVVYATRLSEYQCDLRKGWSQVGRDPGTAFGGLGFLAKRYLSHITGIPIRDADSFVEDGFNETPLVAFHFCNVTVSLDKFIDRNK